MTGTGEQTISSTAPPQPMSRRRMLLAAAGAGSVTAGALGHIAAPAVAGESNPDGPPWARRDHTHDGGSLGVDEPVVSIWAETLHTSSSPRIDVAMFGAVGDGVTDDTEAIRAAMDSPGDDGGIVAFEAGKAYLISGTIHVDVAKVRGIEGNNARVMTTSDILCFDLRGSHTGSANPNDASSQRIKLPEMHTYVRDLRVHGVPELQGTALRVTGTFGLTVNRCNFFDLRNGIEIRGTNRNLVLTGNSIWHCLDYGVWWNRGNIHQTNVVGNHISYCRKVLFIDNASIFNLQVLGNAIESSSAPDVVEHVVHATSAERGFLEGFEFIGNSLEDHWSATGAAVRIEGGPRQRGKQIIITGNDLGNSRSHDIHISDMSEVIIQGNSLDDSEDYSIKLTGQLTAVSIVGNIIRGEPGRSPMGALMVGDPTSTTEVTGLTVTGNIADFMLHRPILVHNASLVSTRITENTLHYAGDSGYAVDISEGISALQGVHVSGNTLRGQPATKALRIDADAITLLIARDNLASGFAPGPYDMPAPVADSVVIADNLAT